jgi:hypothetical protein
MMHFAQVITPGWMAQLRTIWRAQICAAGAEHGGVSED